MYDYRNVIDYSNEVLFNIVHFKHNRNLRANVLINQVYFTAIQALPLVCLISFFSGVSVVELGHKLIGGTQSRWIYEILIATSIRDVGPILTGIIILLRSGNAITSELGAMRVEKEIDALITMGISPVSYLVAPRVVGLLLSAVLMGLYFALVSVLGGFSISLFTNGIAFKEFIFQLSKVLTINDLSIMLIKNILSGLLVGSICTFVGLQKSNMITDIPQKNIKAVTYSAVCLILMNLLFILLEILNSNLIGYVKYA
jgi:phospholipid/cholesterol/gamma-HCH transport system permease protein